MPVRTTPAEASKQHAAPKTNSTPADAMPEVLESSALFAPLATDLVHGAGDDGAPARNSNTYMRLQRTVGNQAVGRMLGTGAPAAPVVQRQVDAASANHGKACGCNSCTSLQSIVSRSSAIGAHIQRSADAHIHGCGCPACSTRQNIVQRTPVMHNGALIQRSAEAAYAPAPVRQFSAALAPIRPIFAGDTVIQRHASWEHRMLGDIKPDDLADLGTWQEAIDAMKQEAEETAKMEADFAKGEESGEPLSVFDINVSGVKVNKQNIIHVLEQEIKRLQIWQDPNNTPKGAKSTDVDTLKHVAQDPDWQLHLVEIPNKAGGDPIVVTYGELNTLADFYGSADELLQSDMNKVRNVVQSVRHQSFEQLLGIYTKIKGYKDEATAKQALGVEKLQFKGAFGITTAGDEIKQMAVDEKGQTGPTAAYSATLGRNACHFAPESWHSWADWHSKAIALAKEAHANYARADALRQQAQPVAVGDNGQLPGGDGAAQNNNGVVAVLQLAQQPQAPVKGDGELGARMNAAHEAKNMAMLYNGFGDHYLQDSYAAGHLINKTQIMQWFVQYLDKHEDKLTYTIDTTWRQFQAMSYDQPGIADPLQYNRKQVGTRQVQGKDGAQEDVSTARNPQSVENTQSNQNLTWVQRFELLGLKLPRSVTNDPKALTLLLYLQENSNLMSKWSWKELKEKIKVPVAQSWFAKAAQTFKAPRLGLADVNELQAAAQSLLDDQIIFMGTLGTFKDTSSRYTTAKLKRGEQVDVFNDNNYFELRKEWTASTVGGGDFRTAATQAKTGNMKPYERMAKAAVYKDFVTFLKDSFLQKSTNALHDYYCINGLRVKTGGGEELGRIYGDMHMLDRESAKGVKHSAETANMSRDSILAVVQTGNEPANMTTQKILKRLPAQAEIGPDQYVGLDVWHNNPNYLRKRAEDSVFANMTSASDVGAGMISTVRSLGKMSKDEDVHGGEAF